MTPWILLRGLTRESRHWGEFPRHLSSSLGDTRVICLDLPGNGRLNSMDSPCNVAAMADYCHAELVSMGISKPCRVLAMSLGAMVAVDWTARYPQDIEAAVLINTSLRPYSPTYHRLRPSNYLSVLHLILGRPDDLKLETAILKMTTRQVADPPVVIEHWRQWRRENPVSWRNALRQLMAAANYRAPLRRPLEHLLLLASAEDGLVNSNCSRTLAEAWRIRLAIHPTAGHDLPLDDERWVLTEVQKWIAALPDGGLTPSPTVFKQHL